MTKIFYFIFLSFIITLDLLSLKKNVFRQLTSNRFAHVQITSFLLQKAIYVFSIIIVYDNFKRLSNFYYKLYFNLQEKRELLETIYDDKTKIHFRHQERVLDICRLQIESYNYAFFNQKYHLKSTFKLQNIL